MRDVDEESEDVDVHDDEDVMAKKNNGLSSARSGLEPRQATQAKPNHGFATDVLWFHYYCNLTFLDI